VIPRAPLIALSPFRWTALAISRRLPALRSGWHGDTKQDETSDDGSKRHHDLNELTMDDGRLTN
jgi:hypothetical protein